MGFDDRPQPPVEGVDLTAVAAGKISVTPLHIDLTHMPTVRDLKGRIGGAVSRAVPAGARA
jgi:5'-nucleotidase